MVVWGTRGVALLSSNPSLLKDWDFRNGTHEAVIYQFLVATCRLVSLLTSELIIYSGTPGTAMTLVLALLVILRLL